VTFSYSGAEEPVLSKINFVAEPGQTTAFIGSTGSGKSTLVNLIPRFYDTSAGEILLDGVDVRAMKLDDLYGKIGYVPQKSVLFSGTVESNIKYGSPEARDAEVETAASIAQATEFIDKMDKTYQTPIAQGGANISGGQKQRLSIARAIARQPEIYIFDDSFSALDFKTDAKLRQALGREVAGKTVLIVAQRISTILSADKIVVLDEGKVVGTGTHQELMKSCPIYQEIASSQLSEEELEAYELDHDSAALKNVSSSKVVGGTK
jgi:ATP-binding cassette subfamily B protein